MATGAPIPMPTSAQILTLSQWLSPAYPVGAFAYSHGLEQLVESGAVQGYDRLKRWLEDVLEYGAGASDSLFLAAAFQAKEPSALAEVNAHCLAFAPSKERLMETELQGAAFCAVTSVTSEIELEHLAYPVALGRAAALVGMPLPLTIQLYLQAFASNLVAAGLRLLPLGQTDGQRLILELAPLLAPIAKRAETGDLNTLSGTTFLADIAAMQHETQYSRIFRT